MNISWKEIGGISAIVAMLTFLERWLIRYWKCLRQRKKLRIYSVFEGSQDHVSPDEILKRLEHAGRKHDLEGVKMFDDSRGNRWRYHFKKTRNRFKGAIWTKIYSLNRSQLEPLLYELVQEGLLKTDGKTYWKTV